MAAVADQAGITFAFATALRLGPAAPRRRRRELGIGTTFNLLGPLANPARPDAQAIGCADGRMAGVLAGVFAARGVDALVSAGPTASTS